MPPMGDEQVQALHALNVLECAKMLTAAIAREGGATVAVCAREDVHAALRALIEATGKMQVYESRAAARGTFTKLDDGRLSQAIRDVRDARILTAGEVAVLETTPEEEADHFSLDDAAPDAPSTEDPFAL